MKELMVVILLAPLMMMAAPSIHTQSTPQAVETKEVKLTAKKYEFSPNMAEVNAGTRIIFKITAMDREHGFEIANVKDRCVKIKKGDAATWDTWRKKPEPWNPSAAFFADSVTMV